jgi:hypothetical protein
MFAAAGRWAKNAPLMPNFEKPLSLGVGLCYSSEPI